MTASCICVRQVGGLDSAITLAIAKADRFLCDALSFDYGQRHYAELDAAQLLARHLGVAPQRTVRIDYSPLLCRGGDTVRRENLISENPDHQKITNPFNWHGRTSGRINS